MEAWGTSVTANKRNCTYWGQCFLLLLTYLRSICIRVPLKHSTKPLVWEWYTDVHKACIPRKRHMAWRTLLMKDVPWSVTTCLGIPTHVNIWANHVRWYLPSCYAGGWPLGSR